MMRLSSLRAVQFGLGTVLVFVPLILVFTDLLNARAAATLCAAGLGFALMAMAVATPRQGDELPPRSRAFVDRVLVVLLIVVGLVLVLVGDVAVGGIMVFVGLTLATQSLVVSARARALSGSRTGSYNVER